MLGVQMTADPAGNHSDPFYSMEEKVLGLYGLLS